MDVNLTKCNHKSNLVKGTVNEYEFSAKHFDELSEYKYGINNGRTSKLSIIKDDNVIIHYDRGWDMEPQTVKQKEIVNTIVDYLETLPKRFENELSL